jgi:hypothetical protein
MLFVFGFNPHFSRAFYSGSASGHVYFVALCRAPRRTVEYACGALGRAPCIHARLHCLATKSREKCGLTSDFPGLIRFNLCESVEVCSWAHARVPLKTDTATGLQFSRDPH